MVVVKYFVGCLTTRGDGSFHERRRVVGEYPVAGDVHIVQIGLSKHVHSGSTLGKTELERGKVLVAVDVVGEDLEVALEDFGIDDLDGGRNEAPYFAVVNVRIKVLAPGIATRLGTESD